MYKDITSIDDVEFFKNNKISEDINLDYKSKLPDLNSDEARLEFLRDLCSFANTQGGHIIYGVDEVRGKAIPESLLGVTLLKPDNEIRRFEDIIRNGLEPVISGVYFKQISLKDNQYIVVLKIPKSSNGPHRVKASLDADHRFYGRTSLQRYELSFPEIRDRFMLSGSVKDKIVKFRDERIQDIQKKDTPVALEDGPKIVLHIIPFTAYTSNIEWDLMDVKKLYQKQETLHWFMPLGRQIDIGNEIDLNGFLVYASDRRSGYVHFYREGIIEAVTILPHGGENSMEISSRSYEEPLLNQKYLNILSELSIMPPFCVFISLMDVEGYFLSTGRYQLSRKSFNKKIIPSKEVILESYNDLLETAFKPLFDRFCNAWGFEKCPHYNQDGSYNFQSR